MQFIILVLLEMKLGFLCTKIASLCFAQMKICNMSLSFVVLAYFLCVTYPPISGLCATHWLSFYVLPTPHFWSRSHTLALFLCVTYPPFLVSKPHIGDPDIGLVVPGSVRVYSTRVLQETRVLHQPRVEQLGVIAVTVSYKTFYSALSNIMFNFIETKLTDLRCTNY